MAKIASLDVVTIATNEYLDYWMNQAQSIEHHWGDSLQVTLHVFTNRPREALAFAEGLSRVDVEVHEIPGWGWPAASAYRYEVVSTNRSSFQSEYVMHLDADMLVVGSISIDDLLGPLRNGIALVRHPGYYRPSGVAMASFYFRNPAKFLFDLWGKLTLGGIGAWETRKKSLASVPRIRRKNYFCGATWWGQRQAVIDFCEVLARRTSIDEKNHIEARWNDESHLNQWASENEHGICSPIYCFAEGYPQLRNLDPKIIALEKS